MAQPPPGASQPGSPPPNQPTAASSVPAPIPAAGTRPGLTWFRLHGQTTVIDFPLHSPTAARAWIATLWPDTRIAGGWQQQLWQPGPGDRGFVPAVIELGDVVQFGIQHTPPPAAKRGTRAPVTLWYGYLHAVRDDAIIVHGPHPGPRQALAAAQQALISQLQHTVQPTLSGSTTHPGGPGGRSSAQLHQPSPQTPVVPGQPPTDVSVAFHAEQATIGDPRHGWLVVPTSQLMNAMTRPPADLARLLESRIHLDGTEPLLTLAALTATHAPEHLTHPNTDPSTPPSPPPSTPPPSPSPRPSPGPTPAGPPTPGTPAPPPTPPGPPAAPPAAPGAGGPSTASQAAPHADPWVNVRAEPSGPADTVASDASELSDTPDAVEVLDSAEVLVPPEVLETLDPPDPSTPWGLSGPSVPPTFPEASL